MQAILDVGDQAIINGFFNDEATGAPRDPDTATLVLRRPGGAAVEINGAPPWAADITQEATGHLRYETIADTKGTWRYQWKGTGQAQGSSRVYEFTVRDEKV